MVDGSQSIDENYMNKKQANKSWCDYVNNFWLPLLIIFIFCLSRVSTGDFAVFFMDISQGITIGNALFSYEKLEGFTLTGTGNKFEWHYGGKKVAWGTMLSGDIEHLREMMTLWQKYRSVLDEEKSTAHALY